MERFTRSPERDGEQQVPGRHTPLGRTASEVKREAREAPKGRREQIAVTRAEPSRLNLVSARNVRKFKKFILNILSLFGVFHRKSVF